MTPRQQINRRQLLSAINATYGREPLQSSELETVPNYSPPDFDFPQTMRYTHGYDCDCERCQNCELADVHPLPNGWALVWSALLGGILVGALAWGLTR